MKYRHFALALLVAAGSAAVWVAASGKGTAQTVAGQQCSGSIGVTQPFNGSTVSGIIMLEATVPATQPVTDVSFIVNSTHSYSGQRSDPYWRAPLDTRSGNLGGNGTYTVRAKLIMPSSTTGTSYECFTAPINFIVQNINAPQSPAPVASVLEVVPSIQSWSGPTNVPFEVVLKTTLISGTVRSDVSPKAVYDWSVTKGVLTPQGNRAAINSGPNSGEGAIRVRVSYSGLQKEVVIPMQIRTSAKSSTYPTSNTAGGVTAQSTPATKPATVDEAEKTGLFETAVSRNGQGDAELERCLMHGLGKTEYQTRIQQQPRLNFRELAKSEQCFVRRNSVIPANLAPIAPDKVRGLPVSDTIRLDKLTTITKNGKDALQISGIAAPGKLVVIYIFSEPLVLVAKADAEGKWAYVLEDPMEPGKHEAFVAVEGDDVQSVARSSGFAFAIAAAPKTKLNPTGLSFVVQNTDTPKLYYGLFAGAVGLVTAAAIVSMLWFVRRRKLAAVVAPDTAAQPSTDTRPTDPQDSQQ